MIPTRKVIITIGKNTQSLISESSSNSAMFPVRSSLGPFRHSSRKYEPWRKGPNEDWVDSLVFRVNELVAGTREYLERE